jgi:pseudaminic acid synthase
MKVNGINIGQRYKPFIIAELSANHGGSLARAKESILKASSTGVSAIKIQTYTPDTMTIKSEKPDFYIKQGLWKGKSLHDLYSEAYTPFEWHEELFDYAKKLGITLFSTPFDESAVDLLESLNTPAYKIASFEMIDLPLIEYIAKKNKPIFMSTGMASLDEIHDAVKVIKKYNNSDLLIFHCISAYPAPTEESNLSNIKFLKDEFNVLIGLSDHTTNNIASITSIGLGAVAIEKHFKLNDEEDSADSKFSLNIKQLTNLVSECNQAWLAKGKSGKFNRSKDEEQNIIFRRSLYFVKNLKEGHIITPDDVRRIRPGYGIAPKYFNDIVGKQIKNSVEIGDPVKWDDIL